MGSSLVYEPLVRMTATGDGVSDASFEARGALRWTRDRDGRGAVFILDPAARFSDSTTVTAADWAFAFRTFRAIPGVLSGAMADLDTLIVLSDSAIHLRWAGATSIDFQHAATLLVALPAHQLDSIPVSRLATHPLLTQTPVGAGRWRVAAWTPGVSMVLSASPVHPKGLPELRALAFEASSDPSVQRLTLQSGESDGLIPMRATQWGTLDTTALQLRSTAALDYMFIGFRVADAAGMPTPVLEDVRVRQALAFATPVAAMASAVFHGDDRFGRQAPRGPMVSGQAFVPSVEASAATGVVVPFDTTRALRLFADAGWRKNAKGFLTNARGRPLTIRLLVSSGSPGRMQWAVLTESAWRTIGVTVTIDAREPALAASAQAAGDFDAVVSAWHVDQSPLFLQLSWGCEAARAKATQNITRWCDRDFDEAVSRLVTATSQPAQQTAALSALEILARNPPAIWLSETSSTMAFSSRLHIPKNLHTDGWWQDLEHFRLRAQ